MTRANPYIGPRAFDREDKQFFHGRARDVERLLNLLIAERIVLLHALSGAGKSSLINAALIPKLEDEGFEVLPVMRVNRLLPEKDLKNISVTNRYLFSAMLCLASFKEYADAHAMTDEDRDKLKKLAETKFGDYLDEVSQRLFAEKVHIRLAIKKALQQVGDEKIRSLSKMSPEELKALTNLKDDEIKTLKKLKVSEIKFLRNVQESEIAKHLEPDPIVLIFDQFEEVLTADPTDQKAKLAFFQELGAALSKDTRWALFSMREDYVASLGSLLLPVPTRLSTHFKLDLLAATPAREAIQLPTEQSDVTFKPDAVDKLIADLQTVKVQRLDGVTTDQQGEYVEPMQLQVVCYRLWDNLKLSDNEAKKEITLEDLQDVHVDQTLADFYEDCLESVIKTYPDEDEANIRQWVQNTLITPGDTRGTVFMGAASAGGMSKKVVEHLTQQHLLRSEQRAGARWYELTHDRFIEPIKKSNRPWLALQKQVQKAGSAHAIAVGWFVAMVLTWLFVEFMATAPLREAQIYFARLDELVYRDDSTAQFNNLIAKASDACKKGEDDLMKAVIKAINARRNAVARRVGVREEKQLHGRRGRAVIKQELRDLDALEFNTTETFKLCKMAGDANLSKAIKKLRDANSTKNGWQGFALTPDELTAVQKIVPNATSTHRETSAYVESARITGNGSTRGPVTPQTSPQNTRAEPSTQDEPRGGSPSRFDRRSGSNSIANIVKASKSNWQNFSLSKEEVNNLEEGFNVLMVLMETTVFLGGLLDLKDKFAKQAEIVSEQLRSMDPKRKSTSGTRSNQSLVSMKYARLFLNYAVRPEQLMLAVHGVWCALLVTFMIYLAFSILKAQQHLAAFDLVHGKLGAISVTDPLGWSLTKLAPPVITVLAILALMLIHFRVSSLSYEAIKSADDYSWIPSVLTLVTLSFFLYYIGVHYVVSLKRAVKSI